MRITKWVIHGFIWYKLNGLEIQIWQEEFDDFMNKIQGIIVSTLRHGHRMPP